MRAERFGRREKGERMVEGGGRKKYEGGGAREKGLREDLHCKGSEEGVANAGKRDG